MPETTFWVNTAMLCHHCQRVAVVRMMQSWRQLMLIGTDSEALDVVFVVCAFCLPLPKAHRPYMTWRKYIDPRSFSPAINTLMHIFHCIPNLQLERKFSITALKIKNLAKIRDIAEIFYIPAIPERNIMILIPKEVFELMKDCKFFSHEPTLTRRKAAECKSNGIFPIVEKRPMGFSCRHDMPTAGHTLEAPPSYQELNITK
jgi:hypothetical protein